MMDPKVLLSQPISIELTSHPENQNYDSQCISVKTIRQGIEELSEIFQQIASVAQESGKSATIVLSKDPLTSSTLTKDFRITATSSRTTQGNSLKGEISIQGNEYLLELSPQDLAQVASELSEYAKGEDTLNCHFGEIESRPRGLAIAFSIIERLN